MATIAQIRGGLKTRLETIDGLRVFDYRPGQIPAPAAIVARQTTSYDVTLDGLEDHVFAVTVYVQVGNDRTAQDSIDEYLSPAGAKSVVAAIHGDPTLGSVVDYARVTQAVDNGLVPYGASDGEVPSYLAATFTVEIGD